MQFFVSRGGVHVLRAILQEWVIWDICSVSRLLTQHVTYQVYCNTKPKLKKGRFLWHNLEQLILAFLQLSISRLTQSFTMEIRWLEDETNVTAFNQTDFDLPEEEHNFDAVTALTLNVTIIGCILLAYYVKAYRVYYLPERYVLLLLM